MTTETQRREKLFRILFLIIIGIAINYIGGRIAVLFSLPLYMDSAGTLFVAALGGVFPGIVVGYFTNLVNSFFNSSELYYGVVSILIAVIAGNASARGHFQKFWRIWLQLPVLMIVCAGIGSLLNCCMNGLFFVEDTSNQLTNWLYEQAGMPFVLAFTLQVMLVEVADKGLALMLVYGALKLVPDRFKLVYQHGRLYKKNAHIMPMLIRNPRKKRRSLEKEVLLLISVASIAVGLIASAVCYLLYQENIYRNYKETAQGVARLVVKNMPVDKIQEYVESGEKDSQYYEMQKDIEDLVHSFSEVKYLHVYQVQRDGGYVVFDLDTEQSKADELGDGIALDRPHVHDMLDLLNNNQKDYIISQGEYGWLFTVYEPIYDSQNNCVAYTCVDMDMENIVSQRVSYVARMVSILLASLIVICAFAMWYAHNRIVHPINVMTEIASDYAYRTDESKKDYVDEDMQLDIRSGSEIERLYQALNKTMTDVTQYISDIQEQAEVIAKMQSNIISVFADMVENRDENTGEHIHRTAQVVGIIARQLLKEGKFPEVLSEQYIEDLEISAPLHDIGKIKISDTILNKPGRLTDAEFETMKTHAGEGRRILKKATDSLGESSYLMISMDMSGYHHERWDGKGYPEQLKGEEIPLSARIMAVADVFDALISKRSYKEPFAFEEAVNIIEEEKGTHFDPLIVEAFMHALGEIRVAVNE